MGTCDDPHRISSCACGIATAEELKMSFAMKGVVMVSGKLFFGSLYTPARKMPSLASTSTVLVDRFGRAHNYLRISLTERCNLRCKSVFLQSKSTYNVRGKKVSTAPTLYKF